MSQNLQRAWVLFSSLAVLHCGREDIELRPAGAPAELAAPAPSAPQPESSSEAVRPPPEPPPPSGVTLPTDPAPPARGCGKVDFLFVIDNSLSMRDEQANLARSFPGFIRVVQQVLEAKDFHIMVVSTGGRLEDEAAPSLDQEACAGVQGAGKRRSGSGEDCGLPAGSSYMVNDQADLEATFDCVARVGVGGSIFEEPMDAMLAATSETLNAAGRCNAGFLREDAVLVVTVITDAEDRYSAGDPELWQSGLLARKADNGDALVVLGLVGDNNVEGGLLGGQCGLLDAAGAPRLQDFVRRTDGILGSVCAPDYAPFFQTAVGSIDSACDDFVPPPIY
jgi:hypothetical protein